MRVGGQGVMLVDPSASRVFCFAVTKSGVVQSQVHYNKMLTYT